MIEHKKLSTEKVRSLIRGNKITYAGNIPAKIYGTLTCSSGKRMKKENRTFFVDRNEAILAGFRPCGRCLRQEYKVWKGQMSVPVEAQSTISIVNCLPAGRQVNR